MEHEVIQEPAQPSARPMAVRDSRASAGTLERAQQGGSVDTSPPAVIARMLQSGIALAEMKGMLELQERWEANEARKAFVAAMANFKANPPTIEKDKSVGYTTKDGDFVGYKHASIGNVVGKIVAGLAQHGLSHRWDVQQDVQIVVTCTVTHERGHSESVTMRAAKDDSGKKNAIQQIASTITYLQRYTLLAVTGLATNDQPDDDGRGSGGDGPGHTEGVGKKDAGAGRAEKQPYDETQFDKNLPEWRSLVAGGKTTPEKILNKVESKFLLLDKQRKAIRDLGKKPEAANANT